MIKICINSVIASAQCWQQGFLTISAIPPRSPLRSIWWHHVAKPAKSFQEATALGRLRGLKTRQFCPNCSFDSAALLQLRWERIHQTPRGPELQQPRRLNSACGSSEFCCWHPDAAAHHFRSTKMSWLIKSWMEDYLKKTQPLPRFCSCFSCCDYLHVFHLFPRPASWWATPVSHFHPGCCWICVSCECLAIHLWFGGVFNVPLGSTGCILRFSDKSFLTFDPKRDVKPDYGQGEMTFPRSL